MPAYRHILAAVDFASSAEQVCRQAAELADQFQAQITLLHVVEYLPPLDVAYEPITPTDWMVDENILLQRGEASLTKLAGKLGLDAAHRLVRLGVPKHTILDVAQEHGVDLVVLGSHGRHGIARLLGSTANAVLHHAECDVLAVRIKE